MAIREVVEEREKVAKDKMKKYYDRNVKKRDFDEGNLILVRTPDLQGILEDVWEGPYEVQKKIGV